MGFGMFDDCFIMYLVLIIFLFFYLFVYLMIISGCLDQKIILFDINDVKKKIYFFILIVFICFLYKYL